MVTLPMDLAARQLILVGAICGQDVTILTITAIGVMVGAVLKSVNAGTISESSLLIWVRVRLA